MTLPPRAVLLGEARRFREALLNARSHLSPHLHCFPNGTGPGVALLLEQHFHTLDLTTQPHCVFTHLHQVSLSRAWLQLRPYYLDFTTSNLTPPTRWGLTKTSRSATLLRTCKATGGISVCNP